MATITIADPMVNTDSAMGTPVRAGEIFDQHMLVYLDPNDGNRAKRANCLQTNPYEHVLFGVSLGAAEYAGDPVHILQSGNLAGIASYWTAAGELFVLSQTAGKMMNMSDLQSGDWIVVVGYSTAADAFTFDIRNTGVQVP